MIRAGRRALDNHQVMLAAGYRTLRTAQRRGLFSRPDMPQPINTSKYKQLWDEEQIHAWLKGEPIPPIPAEDHPDDLLDAAECAAEWGVDLRTWNRYHKWDQQRPTRQRTLLPRESPDSPEGIPHWRRGDVQAAKRPGPGDGAGRPRGATDTRPRPPRSQLEARRATVAQMLFQAEQDGAELVPRQVVARLGISMRLAQSTLKYVKANRHKYPQERPQ